MRELTLKVEANPHAPSISRTYLSGMKGSLGQRFDDVSLVVSELVTNSVQHGQGTVNVTVEASKEHIRLEVSDNGPGFDKGTPRGDGMGLDILDRVADRWGVEQNHGCTVWVEIARQA